MAVFELSLDRMLDEGLGFDRCDVAVITDIGPGIRVELADWDSPDRQVMVHRVVSDVVEAKGALVLPADEPLAPHITKHRARRSYLRRTTRAPAWPSIARLAAKRCSCATGTSSSPLRPTKRLFRICGRVKTRTFCWPP